jgi:hypothetical protein
MSRVAIPERRAEGFTESAEMWQKCPSGPESVFARIYLLAHVRYSKARARYSKDIPARIYARIYPV